MKKRILAAVLACMMAVSFYGCGSKDAESSNASDSEMSFSEGGTSESDDYVISVRSGNDIYNFYGTLTNKMAEKLNELQVQHNNSVGNNYSDQSNIMYVPFNYMRFFDLYCFSENATIKSVQDNYKAFGYNDAVITQNGTNSYTVEYTVSGDSSGSGYKSRTEINYDPASLGASIVFYKDGKLANFTEMQAIGGDKYALSTETDRAIVTYKNGQLIEFIHAQNTFEDDYESGGFTKESFIYEFNDESKVFGKKAVNEEWVREAEKHDALFRLYVLKDNTIKISGLNIVYNNGNPRTYEPGYELTLP